MRASTERALAALNRDFYAGPAATEFDHTRHRAWPGFERLGELLSTRAPRSLLDVGCGNGRFGLFLGQRMPSPPRYVGLDASTPLLASARAALPPDASLIHHDLLETPLSALPDGPFDAIVIIAVLHHLPGRATRAALVAALATRLSAGGVLAFSSWRFDRIPRTRARLRSVKDHLARAGSPAGPDDLEPGDHLVPWGDGERVRYCHLLGDEEADELGTSAGLRLLARFDADGPTDDHNGYFVWTRR